MMSRIYGEVNIRYRILNFLYRLKWLLTGDCGHECGIAWFRTLDGTPFQQFVPEADCPVHDIFLEVKDE